MTFEEALELIIIALAPKSLSPLQIEVLQRSWNQQSYCQMVSELHHSDLQYEYSYLKDVGAGLWKLLSHALGIRVTKLNLQEAVTKYAKQQTHNESALLQRNRMDWGEAVDFFPFCGLQAQLAMVEERVMQQLCQLVAISSMGGINESMLATQLTATRQLLEQLRDRCLLILDNIEDVEGTIES